MKLKISKEIFNRYPGLNIGIVIAKNIDNKGQDEKIISMLDTIQNQIKTNYSNDTLSQNQKISAWRQIYSSFGAKSKYKCSVENLYRMVLDGIKLRHINKVVDIYNYISLKHMIPVGGDDIDKIDGDIVLKFAAGNEKFIELNADEVKNPKPGEVVYCDDKEVLCRRWNWRECEKSKMTEGTKNICLVVEGLSIFSKQEIQNIIDELAGLIEKYCGGTAKISILDESNPEITLI